MKKTGFVNSAPKRWEKVLCGKSKRLREKKFTSRIKKADVIFLSTVTGLPVSPSRENAPNRRSGFTEISILLPRKIADGIRFPIRRQGLSLVWRRKTEV